MGLSCLSKAKHVKIDKPDPTEIFPIVNLMVCSDLESLGCNALDPPLRCIVIWNSSQDEIYEYFPPQHVYEQ